ncbi:unnamed protein product [Pleuronectes platessa]|uniref:Uncharacterized protein n=1 Tax=Pleuronectes platessa TaxID=8262 RepID=A0A9N7YQJ9_PLEPL|nr:unnamed protein product [Pleuronectes platessa]
MLWKEAEKRRNLEPRKPDSTGADSEPEEPADSELQPRPSDEEAEDVEAKPPLKGQFGNAQIQEPTLNNALKNVQVVEGTPGGA